MPETIRIGPLKLRFLRDKHETNGSLDLFEMTVPSKGNMPVPHYHRDWDETVYGLTGAITFTLEGTRHVLRPSETLFIPRGKVHGFDNDRPSLWIDPYRSSNASSMRHGLRARA